MTGDRAPGANLRRWPAAGAIAVVTALVSGTALAEDDGHGEDPAPVACSVSGYDLIIENTGTEPIASGASVEWSVPFARKDGNHVLTDPLEPGGRVFLSGIMSPSYLDSSKECIASLDGALEPVLLVP